MSLGRRHDDHGTPAQQYWRPGKPAPYGNLEIPLCVGFVNCDYWENFYSQHRRHVLLMFITWGVIAFILTLTAFIKRYNMYTRRVCVNHVYSQQVKSEEAASSRSTGSIFRAYSAAWRRYLLPQSFKGCFPYMTRFQGILFFLLLVYAILFSFVGIAYKVWVDPVRSPGRRIGFNEFVGDRTGCLAFALIPLTVVLSSRDNVFSLITGISYQNFNFLHRWVGRWIFIFSFVHTLLWSVELGIIYQPQPKRYILSWKKRYFKWGVGAFALLTYLLIHSFATVRRRTGYEFFRKTHEFVALLFMGACWGHWPELREWIIAGIIIVVLDRVIRYIRMFVVHMNWTSSECGAFGLHSFQGTISRHHDAEDNVDVLILRLPKGTIKYNPGQHFFLTFPTLSLFESHPFTPASFCRSDNAMPFYEQLYIIRVHSGQTRRLANYCTEERVEYSLPTVCCGPYGNHILDDGAQNVQLIAGGTGVSFTLPLARNIVAEATRVTSVGPTAPIPRRLDFVWIIRRGKNINWIKEELRRLKMDSYDAHVDLHIRIFVTRGGRKEKSTSTLSFASPSASSSSLLAIDGASEKPPHENVNSEKLQLEALPPTISKGIYSMPSSGSLTLTDNRTQKTDWLQDHHPKVGDLVREFWEQRCISGRVQVLASGPPAMATELRDAVAECNDYQMVRRGEERGDVSIHWDAREY